MQWGIGGQEDATVGGFPLVSIRFLFRVGEDQGNCMVVVVVVIIHIFIFIFGSCLSPFLLPAWHSTRYTDRATVQGYLAHKKQPPPLGPPCDLRYSPTVGS